MAKSRTDQASILPGPVTGPPAPLMEAARQVVSNALDSIGKPSKKTKRHRTPDQQEEYVRKRIKKLIDSLTGFRRKSMCEYFELWMGENKVEQQLQPLSNGEADVGAKP